METENMKTIKLLNEKLTGLDLAILLNHHEENLKYHKMKYNEALCTNDRETAKLYEKTISKIEREYYCIYDILLNMEIK